MQSEPRPRDVYLGGTCGKSSWRDDVAIPVLLYVLALISHTVVLVAEHMILDYFRATS